MSRIRIVEGKITKNTGGNHYMYSKGNIVFNAGGFIDETAKHYSYGDTLVTSPLSKVQDNNVNTNGYYYNEKDGTFEGKNDDKNYIGNINDVYTCTGKTEKIDEKGNHKVNFNNSKIIKLFGNKLQHSDLLIFAGIVHGEATNQNSKDIGISISISISISELKTERYCIGNSIYNFMKISNKTKLSELSSSYSYAKKDQTEPYKFIINSTDEMRKNNEWIKTAIFSAINAICEIHDYSDGATFWDGPDVMTGNFAGGYDPLKHFRQKVLNGTEYRVQGIYDPKALSTKFYNNAKLYYTKYDTQRAIHLKDLLVYSQIEHYDVAILDGTKLVSVDDSRKNESFNKKETLLEDIGTGVFKVVIKCLCEIKMQSACSVFYKQLTNRY